MSVIEKMKQQEQIKINDAVTWQKNLQMYNQKISDSYDITPKSC